jgi:hypothetical protein
LPAVEAIDRGDEGSVALLLADGPEVELVPDRQQPKFRETRNSGVLAS